MGLSPLHWVIDGIVVALWIVPLWKLLDRLGYRGAWALVTIIPPAVIVLLWVVAIRRWPIPDADEQPVETLRS